MELDPYQKYLKAEKEMQFAQSEMVGSALENLTNEELIMKMLAYILKSTKGHEAEGMALVGDVYRRLG